MCKCIELEQIDEELDIEYYLRLELEKDELYEDDVELDNDDDDDTELLYEMPRLALTRT